MDVPLVYGVLSTTRACDCASCFGLPCSIQVNLTTPPRWLYRSTDSDATERTAGNRKIE